MPPAFPPLTLANSDAEYAPEGTTKLWILGYGQQNDEVTDTTNTVDGILSGRKSDQHSGNWIRTTASMLSGHSGGPAVNRDGHVVGWCVKSYSDETRVMGKVMTKHADGSLHQVGNTYTITRVAQANGGLHALRPINDAVEELRAIDELKGKL